MDNRGLSPIIRLRVWQLFILTIICVSGCGSQLVYFYSRGSIDNSISPPRGNVRVPVGSDATLYVGMNNQKAVKVQKRLFLFEYQDRKFQPRYLARLYDDAVTVPDEFVVEVLFDVQGQTINWEPAGACVISNDKIRKELCATDIMLPVQPLYSRTHFERQEIPELWAYEGSVLNTMCNARSPIPLPASRHKDTHTAYVVGNRLPEIAVSISASRS